MSRNWLYNGNKTKNTVAMVKIYLSQLRDIYLSSVFLPTAVSTLFLDFPPRLHFQASHENIICHYLQFSTPEVYFIKSSTLSIGLGLPEELFLYWGLTGPWGEGYGLGWLGYFWGILAWGRLGTGILLFVSYWQLPISIN